MDKYLCLIGMNHQTMPVAIREKLAIGQEQLGGALALLHNYAPGGLILSTCNRTEVYASSETSSSEEEIVAFLKTISGCRDSEFLPYTYTYRNEQAFEHLFRVACGLDSMIIGEYEVLGQVRQSLEKAEQMGLCGLPLLNLFRQAVRIGRDVREKTEISRNALSVSSVAINQASQILGDITGCRVLVIGAGEAGHLVAKAARERGAGEITLVSRSQEKASSLVARLGSRWAPSSEMKQVLVGSDIVVSCTGSPHLVLRAETVAEAMQSRPDKPLVIIDIAVPRDVDSEAARISNVYLFNIDDLNREVELNRSLREKEIEKASLIINEEVAKFNRWWREYEVRPTIAALVSKAENIRREQLDLTLKKLPRLTEEQQSSLDAMTRAIVQKLLHEPIQELKKNKGKRDVYVKAVNELFQLNGEKTVEESH